MYKPILPSKILPFFTLTMHFFFSLFLNPNLFPLKKQFFGETPATKMVMKCHFFFFFIIIIIIIFFRDIIRRISRHAT